MDKEVLQTKLEALIRCLHRIKNQNISSIDELIIQLQLQLQWQKHLNILQKIN